MDKKLIVVVGILIVLLATGGYLWYTSQQVPTSNNSTATATVTLTPSITDTTGQSIKEFTVTGSSYSFDLKEMRVKKGDKVRVTFVNKSGSHNWVLDEFNVRTSLVNAGKSETVEFVADKTGTFEYYCSVPFHRQLGMNGKLIVE
jgi:cytochrome c oxidase subunit 2